MNMKKTGLFLGLIVVGFFIGYRHSLGPERMGTGQEEAVQAESTESVTLTWSWWGNPDRSKRSIEMLEQYSKTHEGIEVEYRISEWSDYWTDMAVSAAGHVMPDIISMDYFYLRQYADKDLLLDLTPYTESGKLESGAIAPEILDAGRVDDAIFAVCGGLTVPVLVYNKTLLDSVGIEAEECLDLERFLEISKEIYEKTGYRTNMAYGIEGFLEYFCRAYDEVLYKENEIGASLESLEQFYGLYEQGREEGWLIDPGIFAEINAGTVEQDPLVYGMEPEKRSWCALVYSHQLEAVENAAGGEMELGIATWPSDDPIRSEYIRPGQFLCITKDSRHPQESADLINYIINSVEGNRILSGEKGIPVSDIVYDSIREELGETDQKILSFVDSILKTETRDINPPAPAPTADAYQLNYHLIERVCYGELTAKEAAEEMLAEGNRLMNP